MAATAGNSLSIFSVLETLRRRKYILILSTVVLTAGFAIFAYLQPDKYRGTALIAASQTAAPEYLRQVTPPPLRIQDYLWNVREVIYSEPALQTAAKESKKYQAVQGNLSPEQLEELKATIGIKIDSERAFQITHEANDPYDAMNVTNKLAELFLQKASARREQKTSEAATVINEQLQTLKNSIDEKSKQMHDFKTKAVNALPDHVGDIYRSIEATRLQSQELATKIADEQAKKSSTQRELQDLESKGVLDQPVVYEKTEDEKKLEELRFQLADLETRFTLQHPSVAAMKRQVGELEAKIRNQPKKGRSDPSATYLRYSQLKSDSEGIDQRINAYRREQEALAAQLETYDGRLAATPQHEKVIEDMDRELKVGEMQFHALLDKQLDTKLAQGIEQSESGVAFTIAEPASMPQAPYSPQRMRLVLMGIAAGLGLGLATIFLLEQNDTTFSNVDDFQAFTTLPVAGVVPNVDGKKKKRKAQTRLITIEDPTSVAAEQYRILAMKVQQQCDPSKPRAIMITSAAGGEGKSMTAINLATALAASTDGRVLLIDADMRKPRIAEYLQLTVPPDKGFHNLLASSDGKPETYFMRFNDLYVIPGGISQANPVAALSSARARKVFDELKREFVYVIVDSPPVLPIADSHLLAGLTDKVLVVVRARQTPRELFQQAIGGFDSGSLLGAVLNDVDYQRSRYAYAYRYYNKVA
jgi:polysaccharide chain length determinant protein (PEP-CTERM system associated)